MIFAARRSYLARVLPRSFAKLQNLEQSPILLLLPITVYSRDGKRSGHTEVRASPTSVCSGSGSGTIFDSFKGMYRDTRASGRVFVLV